MGIIDRQIFRNKDDSNDLFTYDISTMPQEIRKHSHLNVANTEAVSFQEFDPKFDPDGERVQKAFRHRSLRRLISSKPAHTPDREKKVSQPLKTELSSDSEKFQTLTWKEVIKVGNDFPRKPYQCRLTTPKCIGLLDSGSEAGCDTSFSKTENNLL